MREALRRLLLSSRAAGLALVLGGTVASCGATPSRPPPEAESVAPAPWSDAWILAEGERFRTDDGYRRASLERSLVEPSNLYSRQRLASYALGKGGWDALPVWNPRSRPVDREMAARLERGEMPEPPGEPLWDGAEPTTMDGWIALGRRVFFAFPMRAEVFMEWGMTRPDLAAAVGVERARDGSVPGLVVFTDVDAETRVGITCAICHVAVKDGDVVAGAARRRFDYGKLRLAYYDDTGGSVAPSLARRMASWGPGRADVTEDDDEDPVAIPDLWGLRAQRFLTQAGTIRHESPVALAIRQETQLIDSNHAMVRPPRALSWALAMYVYSLTPPVGSAAAPARGAEGQLVFERECMGCHANAAFGGGLVDAAAIGTDPALARGRGRGTGRYRVPSLIGVGDGAPYLHDGTVGSLEELLSAGRFAEGYVGVRGAGAIPGHAAGTELGAGERAALVAFLETL